MIKTIPIALIALFLFTNCAQLDKAYDKEVIPASTNAVTGEITPGATNLIAKPSVVEGIGIVQSVPHPYATLGGMVLSLAYAGYLGFRNSQNKRAAKSVIAGTQSYKETLGEKEREKLVAALVDAQEASGTRPVVNELRGK